jgi:peptidoglycan/LPS O-acetylase OafA/YrhL
MNQMSKLFIKLSNLKSFFYEEKIENKLDFLDGFRGTLAIWVLVGHVNLKNFGTGIGPFDLTGHYIGVNGFFILSSFLLTYRLFDEFVNKSNNYRDSILIIIKYFLRRLFRIYLPFVITVTLIKSNTELFGGSFDYPSSWYDLVTLKYPTGNHLWTIGPEIKYYAIIPLFCLFFSNAEKTNNYLIKILNVGLFFFSFFFITINYLKHDIFSKYCYVFLNGSLLAVTFYKFQRISFVVNVFKNHFILLIAGFVSMFMYMHGVILSSLSYNVKLSKNVGNYYLLTHRISIYWTAVLFFMLIGSPNFFNNLFETTVLRKIGKFSFGIYLYHPMCIVLSQKYFKIKYGYEHYWIVLGLSFIAGFLFFHCVENIFMKLANFLCMKLSNLKIFKKAEQPNVI